MLVRDTGNRLYWRENGDVVDRYIEKITNIMISSQSLRHQHNVVINVIVTELNSKELLSENNNTSFIEPGNDDEAYGNKYSSKWAQFYFDLIRF